MYLKIHINFINFMVYNTKYQQKAYIIMCIKINVNILCHFLWNDMTNNILLKMCYIFYKASMQLISLYWLSKLVLLYEPERSMSCSWTSMCPPLTDPYKQTSKILNSSISAKDSFKSILLLPWMQYRPHVNSLYKSSINVVSFV